MAGVTVGGGARAEEGDAIGVGYPAAAGAADDDPFGTYDDPGYHPARPPEPVLNPSPSPDEEPAPWAGLVPKTQQAPAVKDRPDPAPATPRRGRGQHAARHGKTSRRSRDEG
jgi:hypothetical protein